MQELTLPNIGKDYDRLFVLTKYFNINSITIKKF